MKFYVGQRWVLSSAGEDHFGFSRDDARQFEIAEVNDMVRFGYVTCRTVGEIGLESVSTRYLKQWFQPADQLTLF